MMGYMHVESAVRAGRLPVVLADMPAPDPIIGVAIPAPLALDAGVPVPPTPPTPPLLPGK
jgi:hypothetical protein